MENEVEDTAIYTPHVLPDEEGGGNLYVIHLRGGAEARVIDLRGINQMREEWLERRSITGGIITFQGTIDGSGEGSGTFLSDEIVAIRYVNMADVDSKEYNLNVNLTGSVGPGDDEDADEDDDDDMEDDIGIEGSKSLSDFKG